MSSPEIYLIAAECEAREGSIERAIALINKLRDNRIKNNTDIVATDRMMLCRRFLRSADVNLQCLVW